MKITKLEHSGVIVEKEGKKIVFDPVEFARTLPEVTGVAAIVITHLHGDHLQPEKVQENLARNAEAVVFAPEDAAAQLPQATVVQGGERAEVAGFTLEFFGKDHASIVAGKVPCQNIGVVVDGQLTNPGDSFDLLEVGGIVDTLLVPEVAPWAKLAETNEFIRVAKPRKVVPVHDGLLSEMGKSIYDNLLRATCQDLGVEFAPLAIEESIEI